MRNSYRKEAIEQGEQENEIEIARNLLKQNIAVKTISIATGITIEEIDNL